MILIAATLLLTVGSPAGAAEQGTVRIVESGSPTEALAFYLFGALTVVACIGIAVSGNIVRMATWLFAVLGSVAALYFLLAANLLAAIQLIVYAGGTLILIIFGVMLTSKSPWVRFEAKRGELFWAGVVCLLLFANLAGLLVATFGAETSPVQPRSASVATIGEALLTTYLLPFEVASVLLLAVMIGAAYLARPEKR